MMTRKEYYEYLNEKLAEVGHDLALRHEIEHYLRQLAYDPAEDEPEPVEAAPVDRHAVEHVTAAPAPVKRRPGRPRRVEA